MVAISAFLATAALFSTRVLAAPIPDSSINEPGVRVINGTPVTDPLPSPTDMPSNNYQNGGYVSTSTSMMMDEKTSTTKMMEDTTTTMMDDKTSTMMMESTTTMMDDNTSTMMEESTTTMMDESTTSTMMMESTTTTMAYNTYTTPSYGSGYTNWNTGYDSCVQQCMQTYGAPASTYTAPPSTATNTEAGNGGSGSTIEVIVAPAQGILRFVPFAVNASVGDTIHFVWNGSPHTVTRSSTILPCNKTEVAEGFFASGVQNKSFTFDIQVNDTETIAYYCGVPGHCPKGMFGFINPPNAAPAATTVAAMMPSLIANSTNLAMQAMYVANKTMGTSAYTWGDNIDMSDVPESMHEQFVQNVFQTRLMFAANGGMLEGAKGAVNADGSPVTIPADITQITATTNGDGTPASSTPPAAAEGTATASSSAPTSSATGNPTGASKTGGAGRTVASSAAVGIAVLVAFMAL